MHDNLPPYNANHEYGSALSRLLRKTSNPKLGLTRIRRLLDEIGYDRSTMRVIQVVGTNGKGSTVAFIESLLRAANISCGLFSSPHLCTARERVRINSVMISEEEFAAAAVDVLHAADRIDDEASFFECITALGLWTFQRHKIDIAIMEAGMGGRLDATTAVDADVLGITSIDFDHQNVLGTTLEAIAGEKIAAARRHQPVFTVQQTPEAHARMVASAQTIGCDLRIVEPASLPLGLYGAHQKINAGLAIALVKALGIDLGDAATRHGLMTVNWPGRFEIIKSAVPLVLDGAHNPAGVEVLMEALKSHELFHNKPLFMVYGSLGGHNVMGKIAALKESGLPFECIYLHEPKNPRAYPREELRDAFIESGFERGQISMFQRMSQTVDDAKTRGASIVVCGSLYSIGELRAELLDIKMDRQGPNF